MGAEKTLILAARRKKRRAHRFDRLAIQRIEEIIMKTWAVEDAKARFGEFLDTCLREGPQLVTQRGVEAAVLVPIAEWQRLTRSTKPTLKELLLTDAGRTEFGIPPRGSRRRRHSG
jgi:antitoxin Phd